MICCDKICSLPYTAHSEMDSISRGPQVVRSPVVSLILLKGVTCVSTSEMISAVRREAFVGRDLLILQLIMSNKFSGSIKVKLEKLILTTEELGQRWFRFFFFSPNTFFHGSPWKSPFSQRSHVLEISFKIIIKK